MARQPKQVLVIPYYFERNNILFAIFKRTDLNCWQWISGGVEDEESVLEAAKRESYEEAKIDSGNNFIKLDATTSIPRDNYHEDWSDNIFVVTEYSFGVEVKNPEFKLSSEHSDFEWVGYEEALNRLRYDSNKTALWELNKRLSRNAHKMHLYEEPFKMIKSGQKKIELRLNDEKRQKIKIGDTIVFSKFPDCNERIEVKVTGLLHYASFKELYTDIPFHLFGRENKSMDWMLQGTYEIYDKEREEKYGALGIRIEKIRVYSV
ncbi:MAG: ASCH domain-containing protein [Bacillota bacterium]|nr:ASCH domain-containing protein [Bacillota bacterium]